MGSLSEQTVFPFTQYMKNFGGYLKKGEAFASEKGIAHSEVIDHHLVPDQMNLAGQVRACAQVIYGFLFAFGATESELVKDPKDLKDYTFEDLHSIIQRTIEVLDNADRAAIDSFVSKEAVLDAGPFGTYAFKTGQEYITNYMIPYFHFHLTTGYCILRAKGVDVGTGDFLNGMLPPKQ